MNWYLKVLKDYATFSGRARRKEYWMFLLFHYLIIAFLIFLMMYSSENFFTAEDLDTVGEPNIAFTVLLMVYVLGTIIPLLAVTARRLHDTGKSGWWYLINIIPYIGRFIIFIFTFINSDSGPNEWGENPKGVGSGKLINQIGRA